jgi:hypothetical protein
MKTKLALWSGVAGILALVAPLLAHHSFDAEYDRNAKVMLKGTVSKVDWRNPHAFIYLDVKDESGKVTTWALETGSPNSLKLRGWTRNSLQIGEQVTIEAFEAKDRGHLRDGAKLGNARTITLSDGRKVFAGSSDDGGPTK